MCFDFHLQTEIELLKAHNIRLLNFPPLTKVCVHPYKHLHGLVEAWCQFCTSV